MSMWMILRATSANARIADHAVVEARADRDQDVAILHRHVGFIGAVHAQHAEVLLVGRRISAQAHQRIRHRIAQGARKLYQALRGVGKDHPAAGIDHRPLGLQQHLHRLLDLTAMALDHRVVGAHRDRLRILELALLVGDVLGNIDQNRAGTTGLGDVERLLQRYRQIPHILDQEVVLDAGRVMPTVSHSWNASCPM
jgi:hypothetical protein